MASLYSFATALYDVRYYAIVSGLVAWYLIVSFLSYRRLSQFPGPRLAAWSSLWLVRAVGRKRTHLEFYEASKKYGSLVRVGPNLLITTDVELLRRMSAARSPYTRSDWYLAFRFIPGVDNVFSMTDEKAHTRRRAQMTNGYLGKENITIEPSINQHLVKFIDLIRRKYVSTGADFRPMDLAQKVQFLTLDVIMDIATGNPLGDIDRDEDVYSYLKSTADALAPLIMISSVPSVQNFLHIPWIAKKLFPTADDEVGFGKLIGIAGEMVAERFSSNEKTRVEKPDMMQSFIRHGLNPDEAVCESVIQILGGSDTTAGAMRTFMLYIMTSPRVYANLQAEIDGAVAANRISSPVVTNEEAKALPYLQAVIKEGLRIFPPGTGLLSKVVPPEGDMIHGKFVPGGTKIGNNMWAMQRSMEAFGADAESFRPERWLEANPERLAVMERTQEMVWGFGKYVCLGRSVALVELNKFFVESIRNFEWTLMDPTDACKSYCYGIFVMTDLWVRVTERVVKA